MAQVNLEIVSFLIANFTVLHGILGEEQLGGASADAQSYWQGRFAACAFVDCSL